MFSCGERQTPINRQTITSVKKKIGINSLEKISLKTTFLTSAVILWNTSVISRRETVFRDYCFYELATTSSSYSRRPDSEIWDLKKKKKKSTAKGWKNPGIFCEERGGILVVLVTMRAPCTSVLTSMAAAALGSKPSHTSTSSASPTLRSICTASVWVIPSKLWWFTSRIRIPTFRRPSRAAAPEELTYNKWGESRYHLRR